MNAILNTIKSPRSRRLLLAAILAASLGACASVSPTYHHMVMRGQVLSTEDNGQAVSPQAQICIGSKDGAAVGQTFDVIRHIKVTGGPRVPNRASAENWSAKSVSSRFTVITMPRSSPYPAGFRRSATWSS